MGKRREAEDTVDNPVVARALKFFKQVSRAEADQRKKELDDLQFEAGEHWDAKIKADRLAAGLPVIEIDLLSGPLNQIEGQAQEAPSGITITGSKPGTAPESAGLLQGFARRFEQQSSAIDVYQNAVRRTSRCGRGGWRMLPEYESDDSFEQVLRLKWIDNWHCVYLGRALEQDGSDRTQALIVDDLTHDEYTARFGDSDLAESLGAKMQSTGDTPAEWLTSERVRVAEYLEVKVKARTLFLLEGPGQIRKKVYADELPKSGKGKAAQPVIPEGFVKVNERPVNEKSCCWYFLNAKEVLEEKVWPIPYIPIFEIEGERRNIDGVIDRRGVVRMGKQLNQMADFHETAIVEQIDLARTAPWLYEWSQIEGFEDIWQNPKFQVGLPYRKVSGDNGAALPPPQRITDEPAIQASVIAAQRAEQLLRAVTGVPDIFANETQASQNNQSGRAVMARQRQQEVGNSKYLVSRNRGVAYTGKVFLAWAPFIYDTPRVHTVKAADEKDRKIVTHTGQDDAAMRLAQQQGVKPEDIVDLKHAAKYDVTVTVGKPYPTQRMETVDIITSAIQAFPPIAEKALPILFRNSDGPGMQELAAALEPQKGQPQIPAQIQQRLEQLDQYAQLAHDELKKLQQERDAKTLDLATQERISQAEIASKERIAAAQEETKRLIAQLGVEQAVALARLEHAQAHVDTLHEHAHDVGLENMQAVHANEAAQIAHEQQLEAGAVSHEQGLESGAVSHQQNLEALRAKPKPTNGGRA